MEEAWRRLKFFNKKQIAGKYVFVGFPGVGLVGRMVIDYIVSIKELEVKVEGRLDVIPLLGVGVEGYLFYPTFYIYSYEDFLFLTGDAQPLYELFYMRPEVAYESSIELLKYLKSLGVEEVVGIAGIDVGREKYTSRPKVYVFSTSEKRLKDFYRMPKNIQLTISGFSGVLPSMSPRYGMRGVVFVAEADGSLEEGDVDAAFRVLRVLKRFYGLDVSLGSIRRAAKKMMTYYKALYRLSRPSEKVKYIY